MAKEVKISDETQEVVGAIEEYLRGHTAYTADQWLKGRVSEVRSSDISEDELVGLRRETDKLINQSVRTSLMIGGIRVTKKSLEQEVGGLKIVSPQGEVIIPPDVATNVTGDANINAVHYVEKPQWRDLSYDARLIVYLKDETRLIVAFEKDRVLRVEESLKGVEPDNNFGFKVSGIKQEVSKYALTRQETVLVRSALAGLNSRLREKVNLASESQGYPSLVPTK